MVVFFPASEDAVYFGEFWLGTALDTSGSALAREADTAGVARLDPAGFLADSLGFGASSSNGASFGEFISIAEPLADEFRAVAALGA